MARQAGITWPLPDDIDDARLEQRLYASVPQAASDKPIMPPVRAPSRNSLAVSICKDPLKNDTGPSQPSICLAA
jgi:hypothetical protein